MEPILHFLIPVLLLLAFFPKINRLLVLKLSILTIIMDFDIFLPNYHRIAYHNIFFLIIMTLIVYFIAGGLASKIALFFLGSHLIFDMFDVGPALLWPISSKLFNLVIRVYGETLPLLFKFKFRLISLSEFTRPEFYDYLTPIGSLILIVVGIIVISKYFSIRKTREIL